MTLKKMATTGENTLLHSHITVLLCCAYTSEQLLMCVLIPGTGMDIPNWEFGGSTVVSSSYVRLTPDRQSKQGMLWNTVVRTVLL